MPNYTFQINVEVKVEPKCCYWRYLLVHVVLSLNGPISSLVLTELRRSERTSPLGQKESDKPLLRKQINLLSS